MTKHTPSVRRSVRGRVASLAIIVALGAASLTACGTSGTDSSKPYAGHNLNWIVPSSAGGGFDTTTRTLEPFIAKELGTNIAVTNKEGGQFAIGATATLNAGADCYTIMTHADPHLLFSYLTQDVGYTYDDFYPITSLSIEPAVYRVRNDSKWSSLKELVADAKAHPGKIKMSVSGLANNNYVSVYQLEKATGAKFNIVSYDGGDPARQALVSGEVDVTNASVFNSLGIAKDTKVLAVQQDENKWKSITDNAPTVNDALGLSLPPNSSEYGAFVTAKCRDEHPDRYKALVKAFQAATSDPDYKAKLKSLDLLDALDVHSAATWDKEIKADLARLKTQIKNNPDIFKSAS